jgi:Asp-tRNA(Asn)/Glu-tRNA(Gln) amidotransferase C subunit
MIITGKQAVMTYMAPAKALSKQQIWMRRHCRKPKEMPTKVFYSHLIRINHEELSSIPPAFDGSQRLKEDDLIDIILDSLPKRWLLEFEPISFDPTEKNIEELLQHCERMKSIDTINRDPNTKTVENKSSTKLKGKFSK